MEIDTDARAVRLLDGQELAYDYLLLVTTVPAKALPSTLRRGALIPNMSRAMGANPRGKRAARILASAAVTAAASTRTTTSRGPGEGSASWVMTTTWGSPYRR